MILKRPLQNLVSSRKLQNSCENSESATKPYQVPIRRGAVKNLQPNSAICSRKQILQRSFSTHSHEETLEVGQALGEKLKQGLLCFYGDLGVGKTTFIRGLAKGLGIKTRIQSPTFTYQRVHHGRCKLYHFDCYRAEKPDELILLDIQAALESGDGVVAIEWAQHVEKFLPKKRTSIHIEPESESSRKITFTQHD